MGQEAAIHIGSKAVDKETVESVATSVMSIMITGREAGMDQETIRLGLKVFSDGVDVGKTENITFNHSNFSFREDNWFVEDAEIEPGDEV